MSMAKKYHTGHDYSPCEFSHSDAPWISPKRGAAAGVLAPMKGLFLADIEYPNSIMPE